MIFNGWMVGWMVQRKIIMWNSSQRWYSIDSINKSNTICHTKPHFGLHIHVSMAFFRTFLWYDLGEWTTFRIIRNWICFDFIVGKIRCCIHKTVKRWEEKEKKDQTKITFVQQHEIFVCNEEKNNRRFNKCNWIFILYVLLSLNGSTFAANLLECVLNMYPWQSCNDFALFTNHFDLCFSCVFQFYFFSRVVFRFSSVCLHFLFVISY